MKILAATDLAAPADEAIRQAHEWAESVGAELTISHVVGAAGGTFDDAAEEVSKRVMQLTGRRSGQFRIELDRGRVGPALVVAATTTNADLVVVGTNGAIGIQRLLLGGVSRYVATRAHCPVLVARRHARTREVVAATDLSDPAAPAILAGASEARRRGGRLTVVHDFDVWAAPAPPPSAAHGSRGVAHSAEQMNDLVARRARRLEELLDRLHVEAE